eukprot:Skav227494  [mRNA]  locus=scaffold282:114587:114793:- [translate_table: standard]
MNPCKAVQMTKAKESCMTSNSTMDHPNAPTLAMQEAIKMRTCRKAATVFTILRVRTIRSSFTTRMLLV